MMDSLSALFAKNRHLLDGTGSTALDEVFRDFFITSMRGILNELGFDPKRRKKRQLNYDDDPPSGYGSYLSNPNAVPPVVVPHAPQPGASAASSSATPTISDGQYGQGGENSPDRQPVARARPAANDNTRLQAPARQASQPVDYTPGNFVKTLGISPDHYNAFREGIARIENARYNQMGGSSGKYAGRYQMGPKEIQDTAHLLGEQPPDRKSFLNDPNMQERYFEAYTLNHHNYLMNKNPKYASAAPEEQLKILGYAHNQGAGGASSWLNTGRAGTDAFGTSGKAYYDRIGSNLNQLGQQAAKPDTNTQPQTSAQPPTPQARPQQTAAAATPGQPPSYLAIGDSLAVGVGGHLGNTSYAQGGWNPQRVNGLVDRAIQNGDVQGKHIILSGGASNAGGNSGMVADYYPKMIQSLKDAGASQVTVMGVGPYSHYDKYGYNDIINKSAQSGGANFTGPLAKIAPFSGNTVQQGVHPNDYRPIVGYVQKNFASPQPTPSVASSTSSPTSAPTQTASSQPTPTPAPTLSQPTTTPMRTAQADIDRPTQIESLRRPMMQLLRPYK